MAWEHDTMMNPRVEELLERAGSKFHLVTLASKRARQINSYFGQLGEGLGAVVPPQVTSSARKPLSIAFEEIAADKILPGELVDEEEVAAAAAAAQADADAAALTAVAADESGATESE
jgi:DNA-directed RNA polymerase subunit omega